MISKVFSKVLLILLALGCCTTLSASDQGFIPAWQVGDSWRIQANYRDQTREDGAWLKPIVWQFEVKAEKQIEGQDCFVVYVTPSERPNLKVQAVLYLAKNDLRMVKTIDVFPIQGVAKARESVGNGEHLSPVLSNDSLIPYDLPMFPLDGARTDSDENAAAVGGENATTAGEFTFVEKVSQKWSPSADGQGFQVVIEDPSKGEIVQEWKAGRPWADSMTSENVTFKLLDK